jgi:hypothetical protein
MRGERGGDEVSVASEGGRAIGGGAVGGGGAVDGGSWPVVVVVARSEEDVIPVGKRGGHY